MNYTYKSIHVIIEWQSRLDKYGTGKITLDSPSRNRGSWKYGSLKNLYTRQRSLFKKYKQRRNSSKVISVNLVQVRTTSVVNPANFGEKELHDFHVHAVSAIWCVCFTLLYMPFAVTRSFNILSIGYKSTLCSCFSKEHWRTSKIFFSSCFVISIFIAVNTFSTVAPLIAWLLVIYHSLTTALILVCDVYLFPIYILKHHIDIRLYYQWFSWISTTKCQSIYVQSDHYTDLIRNSQDKIIDMY